MEPHLHRTCQPPWHTVGLLYFTLNSYLCTYFSRGPFWSYKGTILYNTYSLHAHYMTHLFHLYWTNYINIMNSSNTKYHYIIFCVPLLCALINSRYSSDILLITFFPKVPQNMLFHQCNESHFTPIKMKGMSDLFMDETFWYKWYFTCSESQNKHFFS